MEINISEEKQKRIEKVIQSSQFKTMDEFMDRAADLLLFAEENKNQFAQFLDKE